MTRLQAKAIRVWQWVHRPQTVAVLVLAAVVVLAVTHPALAGEAAGNKGSEGSTIGKYIVIAFGFLLKPLVGVFGKLLLSAVGILTAVAQFNNFVNAKAVTTGWVIVRDLANMFFILILLIMAFGTMLGVDQYSYKNKALSRLLIMAVVINFTRTICGLMIDFAQVAMLTFVNGFKEAAGGNFTNGLAIDQILRTNPATPDTFVDATAIVITFLLALIMVVASLVVVVIFIFTLLLRIVYLWCLVILSPIAFLMKAVPFKKAGGFYGEWWELFTSNVIIGPVLAFFLWLSLLVMSGEGVTSDWGAAASAGSGSEAVVVGISAAGNFDSLYKFVVSLALLIGGWQVSKKVGGATVGLGAALAKGAGKGALGVAKLAGRGAVKGVGAIPAGSGSSVGSRLQLAADNFKTGRLGRRFGLDKDYTERRKEERYIGALRASKDPTKLAKADARELQLTSKLADSDSSKYNTEQLERFAFGPDKAKRSNSQQKADLIALAKRKSSKLLGKGEGYNDIVDAVGGSTDFNKLLRDEAYKAGDKDAYLGFGPAKVEDVLKERIRSGTNNEINQSYADIKKQVTLGADGKTLNNHGVDKLLALDNRAYTGLRRKNKDEVDEALLLAIANEAPGDRHDKLVKQYETIAGGPAPRAVNTVRQNQLKSEQDRKLAGARVAIKKSGGTEEVPADVAARRLLAQNPTATAAAADGLDKLQNDIVGGTIDLSTSFGAVAAAAQVDALRKALEASVGTGLSGQHKPDGTELTKLELLQNSQAYKNLNDFNNALSSGGEVKDSEKLLQESRLEFSRATGDTKLAGASDKDLRLTARVEKEARAGLTATKSGINKARQQTDLDARAKVLIRTARKGLSALHKLDTSPVPPSGELRKDLDTLYGLVGEIEEASKNKDAASLATMKTRLEEIEKLIDKVAKQP